MQEDAKHAVFEIDRLKHQADNFEAVEQNIVDLVERQKAKQAAKAAAAAAAQGMSPEASTNAAQSNSMLLGAKGNSSAFTPGSAPAGNNSAANKGASVAAEDVHVAVAGGGGKPPSPPDAPAPPAPMAPPPPEEGKYNGVASGPAQTVEGAAPITAPAQVAAPDRDADQQHKVGLQGGKKPPRRL